ncbi:hypothetical protein CTheo_7229 [Ceratobasidium theobromae]|uniref:Heat shock protein HSP70 n=1 Tax=Ceratobasidium theobromae TaxID=1582974 RepID=A0A5N5QC50_9AGAM|nr:hypothetical protein CTheo_7229 [Ceratobasidium theobromae]
MASIRAPFQEWTGESKIMVGVDIGTTQSGVAFVFLERGCKPTIHRVIRWPGLEVDRAAAKIPTLVWYDNNKKAVSFGAEALQPQVEEQAEDNALPFGVSLRQIYSDYVGYLLKHTQAYFEDRIIDGRKTWDCYKPTLEVVMAHPPGWGIRERFFLRTAVVDTGFVNHYNASRRVKFVTEAEASAHFCIWHSNLGSQLQPGTNFAVCDAGGSTVDTTLYSVVSTSPLLRLQEQRPSACIQAGAIFVDFEAEKYLRKTLASAELSPYDIGEYTNAGVKDFESVAKRLFRDPNETTRYSIIIAHASFTNASINTCCGGMSLSGAVIKSFFDGCTTQIMHSVDQQIEGLVVPHILLVGGFGDSEYLKSEFKKRYESQGCQITLINDSTSKAVADGAIMWAVANTVFSCARFSYGMQTSIRFDPPSPDHQGRHVIIDPSGYGIIPGRWFQLIAKGVPLEMDSVIRQSFSLTYTTPNSRPGNFTLDLFSYSGSDEPMWMRDEQGTLLI